MGNRKNGGTSDDDLLRAAYDMLADIHLTHNVLIGYKMMPTAQRGVFEVQLAAFRDIPNVGTRKVAQYSIRYPNAQNLTLSGAFFRCANQIDHLLTQGETTDTPARRATD